MPAQGSVSHETLIGQMEAAYLGHLAKHIAEVPYRPFEKCAAVMNVVNGEREANRETEGQKGERITEWERARKTGSH